MKLATLRDGSRDGRLVVVSHDLTRCVDASPVATTLQRALDDWTRAASHLAALAESLEHGAVPAERFHEHEALSPLPRAYARLIVAPPVAGFGATLRHVASDALAPPRDALAFAMAEEGLTVEGGIVAVVGDMPAGIGPGEAVDAIRLLMLVADASRQPPGGRRAAALDGMTTIASACSPVAITPDELTGFRQGADVPLDLTLNGKTGAHALVSADYAAYAALAAAERSLSAGSILGAESWDAAPRLAARSGDTFRLEAKDGRGRSIFGAIERTIDALAG